jgi:class 3 adenylate cyclase
MVALPSGTVTFLFTDIEGSSQLWEQHHSAMPAALARHDSILHDAIADHDGVVFRTVGDAFCAAFGSALDALTAAITAQRGLVAMAWEETGLPAAQPIRVRMALHTGVVETRNDDYLGPPLNRVARLVATGHGGQIVLSRATADLVQEILPSDVALHDLGEHTLKNLRRPEHVFQLVVTNLPGDFPPLRTPGAHAVPPPAPTNLLLATKLFVPPPRQPGSIDPGSWRGWSRGCGIDSRSSPRRLDMARRRL